MLRAGVGCYVKGIGSWGGGGGPSPRGAYQVFGFSKPCKICKKIERADTVMEGEKS